MATITQIEIEGFKAFPKNFKLDLVTGKNLLLYGENGSGKSSLYYALHVLLQSVFKDDKGAKYFKPGDINGEEFIINNEHLINIFRFNEAKDNTYTPYVRITFDDGKIWRLDNGGLSSENGGNESEIRMLNKNSAFINHSYISRFHAARNSEEIDLWNVFYKDILPFHIPKDSEQFLADLYDEIVSDCKGGISMRNKGLQKKIVSFNTLLDDSINRINTKVSKIYNLNFRNEGDSNLSIKLLYYSDDAPENYSKEHFYLYYGNIRNNKIVGRVDLYPPRICIKIKEDDRLIPTPQSHFNEAKLTAIALAVRFAAMTTTSITPGSFLALDDMLISLDMSNRMKVIDYLLKEVLGKYKIYMFTHDRLFYHTFKRIIERNYDKAKWLFGGLYINDLISPSPPEFKPDDSSKIEEAHDAYAKHDYFRCGVLLRQMCEQKLKELLPESYRSKQDPQTAQTVEKNLDEQIVSLEDFCKHEQIDFTPFIKLKSYKDLFLNSTAHNDITSPFYRNEIKACLKAIDELSKIELKDINSKRDVSFQITDSHGIIHTIRIRLRETLKMLKNHADQRLSFYCKCEVLKDISEAGEIKINEGYESIYVAYQNFCAKYLIPETNLLDTLQDRDGYIRERIV